MRAARRSNRRDVEPWRPISNFSAQELVSKISHDMTLLPGDLIACGTSVGVMKEPVNTVTVAIDGIGELTNEFRQ